MKKQVCFLMVGIMSHFAVTAQPVAGDTSQELYFVSDTQQPMFIEKLLLKPDHNKTATSDIFDAILKDRPASVYMLGDVVALGYARRKWEKVDRFLDRCTKEGVGVCGILGNHEVMLRKKRGERNFQKRFATSVPTGYVSVTDSVAVVLLNSNFKALSAAGEQQQQDWYKAAMTRLDTMDAIKAIIVCCHHAPYTNSKIVKGSVKVQQEFVPAFVQSKKAQLFITGHAHTFEHFKIKGKDFLVIGGGGGLNQPIRNSANNMVDLSVDYKPLFHYLSVRRVADGLSISSRYLKNDFSGFETGTVFNTALPPAGTALLQSSGPEKDKGAKMF
ncbi:MAG: metallophosphoesterase [Bacteroidota bacterium]